MFSKVAQMLSTAVLHELIFYKISQSQQSFWATFEGEFVAKNFQKSPNLVALAVTILDSWITKKIILYSILATSLFTRATLIIPNRVPNSNSLVLDSWDDLIIDALVVYP